MTQNIYQLRATWTNLPAETHFFPFQAGTAVQAFFRTGAANTADAYIQMDGFDHLSVMFRLVAGVADTVTLTIESDDGTTGTYEWDETPGSYNSLTNTFPVSYIAANGTTRGHVQLDDCNGRRFHVRLVVLNGASNSGVIVLRATKQ